MQNKSNNPIITQPIIASEIPAKWEKPELFKTSFENTEGGGSVNNIENSAYYINSDV